MLKRFKNRFMTALGLLFAGLFVFLIFGMPEHTYAYQDDVAPNSSASKLEAFCGEKIVLRRFAELGGKDEYLVQGGNATVSGSNGTYIFTSAGSLTIIDNVYDVNGNLTSTQKWAFQITNSVPVLLEKPQSCEIMSGEDAEFWVTTVQDPSSIDYSWYICDSHGSRLADQDHPGSFIAEGWDTDHFTIRNCTSIYNNYSVYCTLVNKSHMPYRVINTYSSKEPVCIQVKTHVLDDKVYVEGLDELCAKMPADYDFSVVSKHISGVSVEYFVDGSLRKEYVPQQDDKVEMHITIRTESEYCLADVTTLCWNEHEFTAETEGRSNFTFIVPLVVDSVSDNYISRLNIIVTRLGNKGAYPGKDDFEMDARCSISKNPGAVVWSSTRNENGLTLSMRIQIEEPAFADGLTRCYVNGDLASCVIIGTQEMQVDYCFLGSDESGIILVQPQDCFVTEGQSISLSVGAISARKYQWYIQTEEINPETGHRVPPMLLSDSEYFQGTDLENLYIVGNLEYDGAYLYCLINDRVQSDAVRLTVYVDTNQHAETNEEEHVNRIIQAITFSAALVGVALILVYVFGFKRNQNAKLRLSIAKKKIKIFFGYLKKRILKWLRS